MINKNEYIIMKDPSSYHFNLGAQICPLLENVQSD